jgi:hypothetical protein
VIADIEVRDAAPKGLGIFARRAFTPGELIFRRRHLKITREELCALPPADRAHVCQVAVDEFARVTPPGCYMNHSCDPNAVRHGVNVVARRHISIDEEITLDYRLNAVDGDSWPCACGGPNCKGDVAGGFFGMDKDWQRAHVHDAGALIRREYRRRSRGA